MDAAAEAGHVPSVFEHHNGEMEDADVQDIHDVASVSVANTWTKQHVLPDGVLADCDPSDSSDVSAVFLTLRLVVMIAFPLASSWHSGPLSLTFHRLHHQHCCRY